MITKKIILVITIILVVNGSLKLGSSLLSDSYDVQAIYYSEDYPADARTFIDGDGNAHFIVADVNLTHYVRMSNGELIASTIVQDPGLFSDIFAWKDGIGLLYIDSNKDVFVLWQWSTLGSSKVAFQSSLVNGLYTLIKFEVEKVNGAIYFYGFNPFNGSIFYTAKITEDLTFKEETYYVGKEKFISDFAVYQNSTYLVLVSGPREVPQYRTIELLNLKTNKTLITEEKLSSTFGRNGLMKLAVINETMFVFVNRNTMEIYDDAGNLLSNQTINGFKENTENLVSFGNFIGFDGNAIYFSNVNLSYSLLNTTVTITKWTPHGEGKYIFNFGGDVYFLGLSFMDGQPVFYFSNNPTAYELKKLGNLNIGSVIRVAHPFNSFPIFYDLQDVKRTESKAVFFTNFFFTNLVVLYALMVYVRKHK